MIWDLGQFNQTATYWAPPTNDGYGGLTFPAPAEILCRWEDINEKIMSATGDEIVSTATVWPATDVARLGWLYLGTSAQADPRNQADAYEIKKRGVTPDLDGDDDEVKAWL